MSYRESLKSEDDISVFPMPVDQAPNLNDLVGKIRTIVEDISLSMESERVYARMGVSPDKTFLLESKPGMGKTMGIKALNNTRNKESYDYHLKHIVEVQDCDDPNYIDLFYKRVAKKRKLLTFAYDIGKYGTAYINMGAVRVQSFFDKALGKILKDRPVLIMVDECDALLGKRSDGLHSEDRKVLETIMKNMQTVHDTPGAYMVLMTNLSNNCDDASLRAGRIDRRFFIDLPNREERKVAFEKAGDKINTNAGYTVVRGMNPEILAEMCEGFSYADIFQTVENAVKQRALEISKSRTDKRIPSGYIGQNRLEAVLREHKKTFYPSKAMGFGK